MHGIHICLTQDTVSDSHAAFGTAHYLSAVQNSTVQAPYLRRGPRYGVDRARDAGLVCVHVHT